MAKNIIAHIRKSLRRISAGFACYFVLGHAVAWAATTEGHGEAAAHGGSSGGLPQFDPSTYSSQIFWLAVTFVILFFYFKNRTLPEISSVLENRQEHIQSDLDTAENLRQEAEKAQAKYESLLANASAEATTTTTAAVESVKKEAETQQQEFRSRSNQEIEEMEARLNKAKQEAMKDMASIAAEVAREAAEKIVGIKADMKQAQSVVQALNAKEAA